MVGRKLSPSQQTPDEILESLPDRGFISTNKLLADQKLPIDIVKTFSPSRSESHRETVLTIGGKRMQYADTAARSIRRAVEAFPFVL